MSSKASSPPGVVSLLCGPRTFIAASRSLATGSLPARQRAASRFLDQCRSRWRVRRRSGYQTVQLEGRRKLVHRVVMEILLGRPLRRQEHVHHLNGDPADNRPANLRLLSASAHTVATHALYAVVGRCMACGRLFYRRKRAPRRGLFCHRACFVSYMRTHRGWAPGTRRPRWAGKVRDKHRAKGSPRRPWREPAR